MIKAVVGGVVLAAVAVTTLVMVGIMLSSSDRVDITDLEVGECFDLPVDDGDEQADDEFETVELIETVDCDDPHTAQVLAVGELNPAHVAQALAEGLVLGQYEYTALKSEPKPSVITSVSPSSSAPVIATPRSYPRMSFRSLSWNPPTITPFTPCLTIW